jgi:mycothiol synthase
VHSQAGDAHGFLGRFVELRTVPASVGDAAFVARVVSASGSSWKPTEAEMAKELGVNPDHVRAYQIVGWLGHEAVAYGEIGNDRYVNEPSRWQIGVFVAKSHCRRGYGHRLVRELLEWVEEQGAVDDLSCSTDSEAGDRFAASYGFEVRELRHVSTLDPQVVDVGQFAGVEAAVGACGVTLTTLDAFADVEREACEHRMYLLDIAAMADEPGQVSSAPVAFDAWRADFIEDQDPGGVILAMYEGEPIGLCIHWSEGDRLLIASTGVAREWRGHGVATAMKLAGVRYALEQGKTLRAYNSAENLAVLKINANLGFVREATVTRWQRA